MRSLFCALFAYSLFLDFGKTANNTIESGIENLAVMD